MRASHTRNSLNLTIIAIALVCDVGCGTSRQYVGTSEEVWSTALSALRPDGHRSSEGPGEFFIPVRVQERLDRSRGEITLCMPGRFATSESAAEVSMMPTHSQKS